MRNNIRSSDTVARWGGEEFIILCPDSNLEAAIIIAEKLRSAINSYTFFTVGKKTASFGVATYKDGECKDTLISKADKALYMAKENGRNRVEYFKDV